MAPVPLSLKINGGSMRMHNAASPDIVSFISKESESLLARYICNFITDNSHHGVHDVLHDVSTFGHILAHALSLPDPPANVWCIRLSGFAGIEAS